MRLLARISSHEYKVETGGASAGNVVSVNGQKRIATIKRLNNDNCFQLLVDNQPYQLFIESKENDCIVSLNNRTFRVAIEDERLRQLRHLIKSEEQAHKQLEIKAPMPGLIVKVVVEEGAQIKKGDGVIIMEAMKMENEIRATADGRVVKILKRERESVEKDMVLMIVE